MAQNLFMSQFIFLVPIRNLRKEQQMSVGNADWHPVDKDFCVRKSEMDCYVRHLSKHTFYYKSSPYNNNDIFYRQIDAEASLLSFSLNTQQKHAQYFLAISVYVDIFFEVSYGHSDKVNPLIGEKTIATDYDLIYLQKAFYADEPDCNSEEGLFYPLRDPSDNHKKWVLDLLSKLEVHPHDNVTFNNCIINLISVAAAYPNNLPFDNDWIRQKMTEAYYAKNANDFDTQWHGEDARFAASLLNGNDNMQNMSQSYIMRFGEHSYTTNRYEKTFANKNGIVFMKNHYPFNLTADESAKLVAGKLPIYFPSAISHAANIYELCSTIYLKLRLEKVIQQMGHKKIGSIKKSLARMANYLSMEYMHLEDIDEKYRFVCARMGLDDDFAHLSREVDLRFSSYSLKLSVRFNRLMIFIAAVTFIPAVLQIIQNEYNSNKSTMEEFINITIDHTCCHHPMPSHSWCCSPALCGVAVIIIGLLLIGVYHYILLPYIRNKHRQFHREMDDEI